MSNKTITPDNQSDPILIVFPKFIGDAINTLPAIELLRQLYPKTPFHFLVRPHLVALFETQNLPLVDVIEDKRYAKPKWGIFKKSRALKKANYQLAVLFRGSLAEAALCRLAGIKSVIGYAQNGRKPLLSYALKLNENHHYIHRYCRIVNEAHGSPFDSFNAPSLSTRESPFVSPQTPTIGCYFGGKNKDTRYYPTALSAQVVALLLDNTPCDVVLLGDQQEVADNQAIIEQLTNHQTRVLNLAGKTSLPELVNVTGQLTALISIDSGPMHMACATGTPCVALVGLGTSPWSIVAPKVAKFEAIVANGFSLDDHRIIESIEPAEVLRTFQSLMSRLSDE
ncbi:glycosyltransferase family 9 protein [Pseudoalteromonas xiamenensis]